MKMERTAGVTQAAGTAGHVVRCVLPREVIPGYAPGASRPPDPGALGAIPFSGRWTEHNNGQHPAKLCQALAAAGLQPVGEPLWARYAPPWMPWFMRRNEIWLALT